MKYTRIICRTCLLALFALLPIVMTAQQPVLTSGVPNTTQRVPLIKLKKGSHFYFPSDMYLSDQGNLPGYSLLPNWKPIALLPVTYNDLAGQTYTLIDTTMDTVRLSGFPQLGISMHLGSGNAPQKSIYYSLPLETAPDTQILDRAIYLDDVTALDALLKHQHFYTKIMTGSGKNRKKYEKVTISQVLPGTYYAPDRVWFTRDVDMTTDTIDVYTTGTNVLPTYLTGHHFSDAFMDESVVEDMKKKVNDEKLWDNTISFGNVVVGMDTTAVIDALGEPQKRSVTIEGNKTTDQWVYQDRILTFKKEKDEKDEKLYKIEPPSK
jgi:hypothetical protein